MASVQASPGAPSSSPDAAAARDKADKKMKSSSSSSSNNNNNKSGGMLPPFSDILWCQDIDGEVMSQGIGGAMVSRGRLRTKKLQFFGVCPGN